MGYCQSGDGFQDGPWDSALSTLLNIFVIYLSKSIKGVVHHIFMYLQACKKGHSRAKNQEILID